VELFKWTTSARLSDLARIVPRRVTCWVLARARVLGYLKGANNIEEASSVARYIEYGARWSLSLSIKTPHRYLNGHVNAIL